MPRVVAFAFTLMLALPILGLPILATAAQAAPDLDAEGLPPLPKLTPWEECYSQIADERIAGCTFVLEQEERESHERVTAYINRGVAFGQKGDMVAALDDFGRALVLAPDDAIALANSGIAHAALQEYREALANFDRAVAADATRAPIFVLRANTRRNSGLLELAFEDYAKAFALDKEYAFAFHERGQAYVKAGDAARALADFDKAVRFNPSYAATYHARAKILIDQGELGKAIRDLSLALERRPNFPGAYFHRGRAYHLQQDFERAIADYSRVIEISPEFAPAYNNRGRAHAMLKHYPEALADLARAETLAPGDTSTAAVKADVLAAVSGTVQ